MTVLGNTNSSCYQIYFGSAEATGSRPIHRGSTLITCTMAHLEVGNDGVILRLLLGEHEDSCVARLLRDLDLLQHSTC